VDKGTFTPLPNEIKKMRQQLDKRKITLAQVDNLLIALAKKYDVHEDEDSPSPVSDIEANVEPEVVLSETFLPK